MEKMESGQEHGTIAVESLLQWATFGMPSSLASTVSAALKSIATTGLCRSNEEDWALFGEVCDVQHEPTMCVHLRRTSMLLADEVIQAGLWETFDILCPVTHTRVDFSPGMLVGVLATPANRLSDHRILADAAVPVWNISKHDRSLAWQVSHLFAGAYEGWL